MERHNSTRPVSEYESNYINSAGYWMAFHELAIELRSVALSGPEQDFDRAKEYDVGDLVSIRYGLIAIGLRAEFYKICDRDPLYAKTIMPALEQRNDVPATDDLEEAKEKLDSHLTTHLMKALATLSATNAMRRSGKKGRCRKSVISTGHWRPHWRSTQCRVEAWCHFGCLEFLCRAIKCGIFDGPDIPFTFGTGEEFSDILQSEEDPALAKQDLTEGWRSGIYQEITLSHAAGAKKKGSLISSAFVVWQDAENRNKVRFVMNLPKQSK